MKNIYRNENSIIFQNKFFDLETGNLISPIETQNYVIIQVAESYFNNSFHFDRHLQHCDLELTYPLTNGMNCIIDKCSEKLNRHDVHLSFKGEYHELSSARKCHYQTLAINFKAGPCFSMLEEIREKFSLARNFPSPDIASLLSLIISEFIESGRPFSKNNLDGLITLLLVKILRKDDPKNHIVFLSLEEKLPAIINYIDINFLKICSLDDLSAKFGYTYGHLCRLLKSAYGYTPNEYLLTKKMEYSITLLKKGLTLGEIAEQLGYSTPYNFSRAFKKHYGVSPKNFK